MKIDLVAIHHVLERITDHADQPPFIWARPINEDGIYKRVFDDEEIKADVKDPRWARPIICSSNIVAVAAAAHIIIDINITRGMISTFAATYGAIIIIIVVRSVRP